MGTIGTAAADLYIPQQPIAMIADAPHDWSGFYLGTTIGAQGVAVFAPGSGTINGTGALGGIFAGVNFQKDNIVFGVEGDAEYSSYSRTFACQNPAWSCNTYLNVQGSVRAKLGFAAETLLFYGTAGLAVGNFGGSTTSPANVVFPDSQMRVGWTVGAGIEAAFDDNWFGRIEYRYTDFGAANMTFDVAYPGIAVTSHAVRAGIGYKF